MYYYDYDNFNTYVDYEYPFDISMDRLYNNYEILYEVLKNPILREAPEFVNECIAGCYLSYKRCMLAATTPDQQRFCRRILKRCKILCYQKFSIANYS